MTSDMVVIAWTYIGYFLPHLDEDIRRIARRSVRLYLKIEKKSPKKPGIQLHMFR